MEVLKYTIASTGGNKGTIQLAWEKHIASVGVIAESLIQELEMIATQNTNPKVDAYCAKVQPFAQPILAHLRELVHRACPEVEETIKWSRPFFEYRGAILCNMSAFKEHCSFGFWGEEIGAVLREAAVLKADGMGSLGRITTVADLPSGKQIVGLDTPGRRLRGQRTVHQPDRGQAQGGQTKTFTPYAGGVRGSVAAKQEGGGRLRGIQPKLQTRIRGVDCRGQTPGDAGQTDRHRSGVDRRGQAAQLEISELLIAHSAGSPVGRIPLFSTIRTTVR